MQGNCTIEDSTPYYGSATMTHVMLYGTMDPRVIMTRMAEAHFGCVAGYDERVATVGEDLIYTLAGSSIVASRGSVLAKPKVKSTGYWDKRSAARVQVQRVPKKFGGPDWCRVLLQDQPIDAISLCRDGWLRLVPNADTSLAQLQQLLEDSGGVEVRYGNAPAVGLYKCTISLPSEEVQGVRLLAKGVATKLAGTHGLKQFGKADHSAKTRVSVNFLGPNDSVQPVELRFTEGLLSGVTIQLVSAAKQRQMLRQGERSSTVAPPAQCSDPAPETTHVTATTAAPTPAADVYGSAENVVSHLAAAATHDGVAKWIPAPLPPRMVDPPAQGLFGDVTMTQPSNGPFAASPDSADEPPPPPSDRSDDDAPTDQVGGPVQSDEEMCSADDGAAFGHGTNTRAANPFIRKAAEGAPPPQAGGGAPPQEPGHVDDDNNDDDDTDVGGRCDGEGEEAGCDGATGNASAACEAAPTA